MGMMKEFRDFAVKGNVIDLAVGVIIGAAFGKIVDSLVKDLINPIIGFLVGKPDFTNLYLVLKAPEKAIEGAVTYDALIKAGATVFGYGAFLTVLINFLILAFIIFQMIKAFNRVKGNIDLNPAAAPAATPEDVILLREIRDALKK